MVLGNKGLIRLISGMLLSFVYISTGWATETDTLLIRGSNNYPPFEFIDEAGKPDGFNVDLMRALMRELGYDYDLQLDNWDNAIHDINDKRIDIIMGMIYSPERAKNVRFSLPVCVINRNFITRKSDGYKSLQDLYGKELVVEKGGWFHRYLQEQKIPCTIVESDDIYQSLKMLESGKYDAVLASDLVATYAMKQMEIKGMEIGNLKIQPQAYSIVVNQDQDKLLDQINTGLQHLKSSGEYDQIYNKWFGIYESQENYKFIFVLFAIFLGVASLLVTFVWLLRRQVKRATRMLDYARQEVGIAIAAGNISAWSYVIETGVVTILHGKLLEGSGGSIDEIYEDIYPDDLGRVKKELEALSKGIKRETDLSFRIRENKEASYWNVETKMVRVEATKELPCRIVGTLKNVTEEVLMRQKLEEYRLKSELIIRINDIILIQYDVIPRMFTRLNDDEITRRQSAYDVEEYLSRVYPEDLPLATRFISNMDKAEESRVDAEFRIISEEGVYNWYSITASAYKFDEQGRITSYIGLRRNNNKWKAIQNDLIQLREKAEASNRLKSAFVANMSHEIRTPLNAIVGFSELIMEASDEEERRTFMDIVKTNNELLLQLINDILDLSRIESGFVNFSYSTFDFAVYFQELAASLEIKATENVKLVCNNRYDTLKVCSDRSRLSQVITNFVTNAFKFTAKGSVTLDYIYENEGIKVTVADTGIGMLPENLSRVFERFEKINDFAQGTGLGLSICKVIIEALQGQIGVESGLGSGSTFWFWVPCNLDMDGQEIDFEIPLQADPSEKEIASIKENNLLEGMSPDKQTLLIADDIDNNFLIINSIVKESYNVIRAKNGVEAVNLAHRYNPDIILMDMKMPLMGGLDATKEIRKFNPNVPIVALTAYVFDTNRQDALHAGCNEFLAKPVKRDLLMKILGQCR